MAAMFAFILLMAVLRSNMVISLPSPPGLKYIGITYNLLKGNPDGDPNRGNIDVGLKTVRRVYQFIYNESQESVEGKYKLPDFVVYSGERDTRYSGTTKSVFIGQKSYQKKLSVDVSVEGSGSYGLASFSFAMSHRSNQMTSGSESVKNVYIDEKHICSYGTLRLRYKKNPLTVDFTEELCGLPDTYTKLNPEGDVSQDTEKYLRFFDDWGTHVITEVQLGAKTIKRYKNSVNEFTSYLLSESDSSVSVGGGYGGFSASLSVDISKANENQEMSTSDEEVSEEIKLGTKANPEPIHLAMIPIFNAIRTEISDQSRKRSKTSLAKIMKMSKKTSDVNCNLDKRKVNLEAAFPDYPSFYKVKKPTDPELKIPLDWPEGRYGLPKPRSGCPREGDHDWREGSRYYDTEDDDSSNSWSNNHFAGSYGRNNLRKEYCMKTSFGQNGIAWGKGSYCIYRFDGSCPKGFENGFVYWDDEDDDNQNKVDGHYPDGAYDRNTKIQYCCRDDGSVFDAIFLPIKDSYYLIMGPQKVHCQKVHGMRDHREWLYWDTEDDNNSNKAEGKHPGTVDNNIRISYCYYTRN